MRRVAVLLLAAAPLALAACGGGSSSSQLQLSPTAYVVHAAKKSAQATSEHVEMKATATIQGQPVGVTASGDFDNADDRGSLTAHANLQGIDMQVDEVLDGATVYMKSPLLASTLPSGKTWLKVDLGRLGKANGFDLSALTGGQTPAQSFAQLAATGKVQAIGDETIDGVETTHYRGRLAGIKAIPYDAWVGKDDGYVRRMTMTYSVTKPATGSISLTTNFSDFGKGVIVDVPSSDDTVDMTDQSIKGLGG